VNCDPRFPSPPEASPDNDNRIDLSITSPRYDLGSQTATTTHTPSGSSPGPRQRRFEFDAKVIRDSIVMKLRSIGHDEQADAIDECHREAVYKRCCGCRHVRTFYNRCERFYCPICAARLARDRRETVQWWSKVVSQPKHVVLTVKSVPHLTKAYVRQLKDDFRKLRSQAWAKEGKPYLVAHDIRPRVRDDDGPFLCQRDTPGSRKWCASPRMDRGGKWLGGFWSLDITYNRPRPRGATVERDGKLIVLDEDYAGGWHVHFHVIVDCRFIPQQKLEREWAKLRGQSEAVVRVYDVRGRDYTAEVTKYVADGISMGNWPADKIGEFCDALTEERCFDTFGTLYKQRAEWTKAKEEIHADRDQCPCGCNRWEFFDAAEWEWQQIKSDLSPPAPTPKPKVIHHPELFAVAPMMPT
jgi:hypothetical protein